MLWRIYTVLVLPHIQLALAKLVARLRGRRAFRVAGENMEPTLALGTIFTYVPMTPNHAVQRGSIVAFTIPDFEGHAVPTRVVAVGGDRVRVEKGRLFVNDDMVHEPYVKGGYDSSEYSIFLEEIPIPRNNYYVLGDNRDVSKDSRYFGPLPQSALLGARLAPP
jgi:signal peptidase I